MVIQPMKKKDGSIFTNVELTKIFYNKLKEMRDGTKARTPEEKAKHEDAFYRICGGSQNADEIMSFMKQIVEAPDERTAQNLLARGLIPVPVNKIKV